MPEVLMSPGGNNQGRRSIPRTSTQRVCGAHCLRPGKTALRNGAPPRTVLKPSQRPLELGQHYLHAAIQAVANALTQGYTWAIEHDARLFCELRREKGTRPHS